MTHVLYILVRTDLDSMNSGKGIAQGSHASNKFTYLGNKLGKDQLRLKTQIEEWEAVSGQGFGTVLTLGVSLAQLETAITIATDVGLFASVVHDDSYPIKDGDNVHHIPLDTCGFVFVPNVEDNKIAKSVLGRFSLHP